jgi:hypothetical protein
MMRSDRFHNRHGAFKVQGALQATNCRHIKAHSFSNMLHAALAALGNGILISVERPKRRRGGHQENK